MSRPQWEVADILNLCRNKILESTKLPQHVKKTALDIMRCRTAALGGHELVCNACGSIQISYNSCRNRHCPKCQYSKREQWIQDRQLDLLPVRYHHVIFTLPQSLNKLARSQPGPIYNLLFKAAWHTINTLSRDRKWIGGQSGMIALLHTWGQNLSLHPHLHCLVPNGGFIPELNRWVYPRKKRFLFPVRVMSKMFRGKFIQLLESQYQRRCIVWKTTDWSPILKSIQRAGFNVFTKMAFSSPKHIIEYLARYSHRVAITNQRIINVNEKAVSFRYKDYRDGNTKVLELSPEQFVQRFLLHVLPKRFAKIRHYGILANRDKTRKIASILHYFERRRFKKPKKSSPQRFSADQSVSVSRCQLCGKGQLMPIEQVLLTPCTRGSPKV